MNLIEQQDIMAIRSKMQSILESFYRCGVRIKNEETSQDYKDIISTIEPDISALMDSYMYLRSMK